MSDQGSSYVCALCGKPISLEDSNIAEDGKAVHGDCYYEKVKHRKEQQKS